MISPETCNFPAPACLFQFEEGNVKESNKTISSTIQRHHFNHLVSVFLPDTAMVPPNILNESLSQDCFYYKILNVPVSEMCEKIFVEAFVKKGQLTAMSIDTKLDIDNCFCLPPSGHIVLSLDKVAYEQLGIEGQATHFSHMKPALRYNVIIDLKADHFKPGKKNFDRIHWCFKHGNHLKFNILIAWDPPDESTCPSSVAAYFAGLGYTVQQCESKLEQRRDRDLLVPHLGESDGDQMLEWLGACALQTDLSETADSYISTYFVPAEDSTREKCQLAYLQWTGFFTTKQIAKLFAMLRNYVESRESLPWIAMHVQGFEDTPVCWNLEEHHFQQSGDNSYTMFLQPDLKFLLCQVLGPKRKPFAKSRQRKKKV